MPAIQYTYQSADPNARPTALLRLAGPYLPVRLTPAALAGVAVAPASTRDVTALIDTGSAESCIHEPMAAALGLRIIDRRRGLGAADGRMFSVYLAALSVPSTGQRKAVSLVGVTLSEHWPLVLGRDFLGAIVMTYDGVNGIVTISA